MPEQVIKKIRMNILPVWKMCFVSALVFGLIAHLYKITNWLPNWDSLVFRYDGQNMLAMGRWFLPVVCAPGSFYDLPFLAGLSAILLHGLGAVCICRMFDVRKKITAILIGAVVSTFPAVTSVMMYNYVADGYAFAFLLSCIAAMLLVKKKPCFLVSALLIAFSCGIYQAYLTVTVMLLLMKLIIDLYDENTTVKKSLVDSVRFLLTGAVGMIIYYLIFKLLLKITNTEVLSYQGFDSATSMSGLDIAGSLYTIKESFVSYFFDLSTGISAFFVINCVVFVLTAVMYLVDIFKKKIGILKTLLLFVYAVFLPVGASVLSFVNSGVDYHNLMKMGFVVFYLFFVLKYESLDFSCKKANIVKSWLVLSITLVLVFNHIVIANVGYHKLNMAYEKSYGTLLRIADRIEQTDGTEDCDRVLVIGQLEGSEAYSTVLPPDLTGATDGYILRADDEVVSQSVLCSALNDYCAKDYDFVYGKEKEEVMGDLNVQSLDNWPAKNSICVVNDIIVIKLSDKR